jgi:hypothetical protein
MEMNMQNAFTRSPLLSAALLAGLSAAALLAPAPAQAAPPTITRFVCPIDNGGGRFYCFIDYASDSPATVSWSGQGTSHHESGHSDFYGRCSIGWPFTVTVTVTNASGSVSRTSVSTLCRGGPIIL